MLTGMNNISVIGGHNSTFCKFKMAAAFLGIHNGVAAILNENQPLPYLGQYWILLSTKQHKKHGL